MQLSVIIVNYKTASYIAQCLKTAMQFPSYTLFEWIVVDNHSEDNSKEFILKEFPFVKWIAMNYNAGFARANNEGIRQSKGSVVLLLNPDTLICDNAIQNCFERFCSSACVACGVQLLNADHSLQISGNFFMKGGFNVFLPLPYLGSFLRSIAFSFGVKKTHVRQAADEQYVDWINGAFLMVKKTAIQQAGMLDEDFFLYAEEIEWCSRLKKAGCLCIYGNLHVIHLEGESINRATQSLQKGYQDFTGPKGLQLMVSQLVRIRKQYGKAYFLFHLFVFTIEIPIFFIVGFFDNLLHAKQPFRHWKAFKSYTKNVEQLWQLSGTIYHNKPYFYKMF